MVALSPLVSCCLCVYDDVFVSLLQVVWCVCLLTPTTARSWGPPCCLCACVCMCRLCGMCLCVRVFVCA